MPVVVVSSACTDGTFSCAGPFSSAASMGFTGTRGDGFILVERTKGAGSMNSLGFTMTVWHTGQRDPHISKESDKQLAKNMCGVGHFVWTG